MARGVSVSHAYLVTGCHVTTTKLFHNALFFGLLKYHCRSDNYPLLVSYPILDLWKLYIHVRMFHQQMIESLTLKTHSCLPVQAGCCADVRWWSDCPCPVAGPEGGERFVGEAKMVTRCDDAKEAISGKHKITTYICQGLWTSCMDCWTRMTQGY